MSFIPYVKGQPRVERQGGPDPLAHAAAWAELLPGGGEKSGSKGEAEEGGGVRRRRRTEEDIEDRGGRT